jgi:hypothetical protein
MTKTLSHTLSEASPARRSSERRRVLDLFRSLNHQLSTINHIALAAPLPPVPAPDAFAFSISNRKSFTNHCAQTRS